MSTSGPKWKIKRIAFSLSTTIFVVSAHSSSSSSSQEGKLTTKMSRRSETISSYRNHFEDSSSSSASYQMRVSSPSPSWTREARQRSASYTRSSATMCTAAHGAICLGAGMGPAMDLETAAAANQEFLNTRTSERKEMVVLNHRLVVYIEKARTLEQQNRLLESEIGTLQNRCVKQSALQLLYEEQFRERKKIADQVKVQREIEELMKELCNATASAGIAFSIPDLASTLKQMQAQYEDIAAKNLQEMDDWYKTEFNDLNGTSTKHGKILQLEQDLKTTKEKITLHLREYQDLLNIKMPLDIEIITYMKLIEGGDSRLSTMVRNTHITSGSVGPGGMGHGEVVYRAGQGFGHGHISASESICKEQAVEMTERKKQQLKDKVLKDTQERTITITGAGDDTDED
ncbi:alpha-internexin-like [Polyodon spathula]|uniref:alpha-internexin-like n=1 Tax=Polyodon spathula TaxID=7913 RepID=UPI001B7F49F3|nr:alpha-internexin-like [Polyodon spathula]